MEKKLYSISEVAGYLNVSIPFVRKLIRNKSIPFYRIGNRLRFSKEEIDDWLETQKEMDERRLLSLLGV